MRLFTAVDLSPEVQESLARLLDALQPSASLRWSRIENLHLTLKFIGEWPEPELGALQEALRGVPRPAPFDTRVSGLGYFPNERAPRVFWAGVQAPDELVRLAGDIEQALAPLGVAAERRPYSPHLTLARIQPGTPLDRFRQAVQGLPTQDFGVFRSDRFHLYLSRPGPSGSVYTRIESHNFS